MPTVTTYPNCTCCSSSSSSSSSSSGGPSNPCCPAGVPNTLHASWSYGVTHDCVPPCANPYPGTLTWNGVDAWVMGATTVCGMTLLANLKCESGTWVLRVTGCAFTNFAFEILGFSCSPFELEAGYSFDGLCCPDGTHGTGMIVTITA